MSLIESIVPGGEGQIARGHENFVEAFRHFARRSPRHRIEEESGVVRIASGMSTSAFNVVFVAQPVGDPQRVLRDARAFMERSGVENWRVVAFEGAAASLSLGMPGEAGSVPGMILSEMPSVPPALSPSLRIERASTPELWATMLRVGMQGMGDPWENVEWVLPFEPSGGLRGYLGFEGERAVATSLGFSHAGMGGVFFVATLPEVRGRGYGTALTWRAAIDAREEGWASTCLQSSKAGHSVYRKMGYRDVTAYSQWTFPGRSTET